MIVAQKPGGDSGSIGGGPMRRTEERDIETGQQNQLRREYDSDVPPKMDPFHLPFFFAQCRSIQLTPAKTPAKAHSVRITKPRKMLSPGVM
jgi:hypothetical protein